jgi:hypothetical protein
MNWGSVLPLTQVTRTMSMQIQAFLFVRRLCVPGDGPRADYSGSDFFAPCDLQRPSQFPHWQLGSGVPCTALSDRVKSPGTVTLRPSRLLRVVPGVILGLIASLLRLPCADKYGGLQVSHILDDLVCMYPLALFGQNYTPEGPTRTYRNTHRVHA